MQFKKKLKLNIVIIFSAILLVFLYANANKVLLSTAEASFEAVKSNSAYLAIGKTLEEFGTLNDVISIEKDNLGNIVFVSTNTLKLNAFSKKIADKTYEIYSKTLDEGVDVPIGAFTGVKFLSGIGFKINFKLISIASVKCEYSSVFKEAGINQTQHQLILNVVINYDIVTGFNTIKKESKIEVVCYDNVILGNVPEIYLTK